jgi:hypothetical protein
VPFLSSISVFCATAHERTALFSRRGSDRLYSGFAIVAENISGWFRSLPCNFRVCFLDDIEKLKVAMVVTVRNGLAVPPFRKKPNGGH